MQIVLAQAPTCLAFAPSKSSWCFLGLPRLVSCFPIACLSAAGFTWPLPSSLLLLPDRVCFLESWLLKLPQCPSWGHCRLSMTKGALLQLWECAEHCRVIWWPRKRPLPSSVPHYHWALMNSARSPWPSSHTQNITRSYGCVRWVMVPSVSGLHSLNYSSLDLFQRMDGKQMPPLSLHPPLFSSLNSNRTPLSILSCRTRVFIDLLNMFSLSACYVPGLLLCAGNIVICQSFSSSFLIELQFSGKFYWGKNLPNSSEVLWLL